MREFFSVVGRRSLVGNKLKIAAPVESQPSVALGADYVRTNETRMSLVNWFLQKYRLPLI